MRMTRKKDNFPCRIAGGCKAEEWMQDHYTEEIYPSKNICYDCPFEELINKLADYEDKEEMLLDDGK
jgi:hypothetical protein